jgi:hypothetical protein
MMNLSELMAHQQASLKGRPSGLPWQGLVHAATAHRQAGNRQASLKVVRRVARERSSQAAYAPLTRRPPVADLWIVGCNPLKLKHAPALGLFAKPVDRGQLQVAKLEEKLRRQRAVDEAMKEFDDKRRAAAEAKEHKETGKDYKKPRIIGPPVVFSPDKFRVGLSH